MGFLIKYALASMALSVFLLFIYDQTIGRLVTRVTNTTVRAGVFVGVWTAVTAFLGWRGFGKGVSSLRQRTKSMDNAIGTLPKDVH